MKDLTGKNLRGYEILEKIGQGGAGAVYRASQPDVNREVAIKIILPEHASKPEFAQRFAIEGRLIARLEHPHIIPLYDYWQDAQGAYLVMRWLRGGTLRHVLEVQGALSLAQTARWLDQIAEALMAAHQLQVIHRDLKPENILLDERGNAYLTDFGIAKALQDNVHITGENTMLGTPAYLAPEQIRGEPVSPQTDIYSLGIMLFEMLCGHHPYNTQTTTALLVKHLNDPLPSLYACRPDLPFGLEAVLHQATAKNPAQRFPDALALAMAFSTAAHLTPQSGPLIELPTAVGIKTPADNHFPTPNDTASRNRHAMLQNVGKFWIEGVLQNSLRGAALVELGMSEAVDRVDTAWNAVLRDFEDSQEIPLASGTSIVNVFDQMNGKLLILGDPGSGKTTTLLRLTRDLLYRSRADEQHPIPVIFNLSTWAAERPTLEAWLVGELNARYQVPTPVAEEWVQMDRLLLLLDGLDEVALEHRDACVLAINTFRQAHGFTDVVVCSRIHDYEALTHQLKLNGAIVLKPLDEAQMNAYLEHVGEDINPLRAALAEDEMLRDMAQSPLMLSIMTLVFRGTSARELLHLDTPEIRRKHIFDRYITRMFGRRTDSPYSLPEAMRYLAWLARQMVDRAESIFYIEGLQPGWLDSAAQERQYVWMVAGLHGVLYSLIVLFVSIFVLAMPNIALIFLPIGFLMGFGANFGEARRRKIQPVEAFRWSWSGLWEQYREALPPAVGVGTFVGLAWLVGYNWRVCLCFGIVTLLNIYAIKAGVTHDQVARKVKPNEGIWRSLRNGWQLTVLLGLIFVVPVWAILGWRLGLAYMLFATIGGNILGEPSNRGSAVVVRHLVLRWMLYRNGHIPMNYAAFLDEMSKRVLLRKVGGGYIFIHRLLLEYFASLPDEPSLSEVGAAKSSIAILADEDLVTA